MSRNTFYTNLVRPKLFVCLKENPVYRSCSLSHSHSYNDSSAAKCNIQRAGQGQSVSTNHQVSMIYLSNRLQGVTNVSYTNYVTFRTH